jgi:dipeptidyl aminopeptidase/acylaminoacyl peptidase
MRMTGFFALLLASTAVTAVEAKRPVTVDDFARIADVSDPQIDPAGEWIAYTVKTSDVEKDKSETHLWMVSWDGKRSVQLTNRKGESESSARFSPNGEMIAFISGRGDEDENGHLWMMNRAGGEAQKLEGITGSVDDLVWSPDSKSLALIVSDIDPEPPKGEDPEIKKRPKPIVIDRFQFKQDNVGYLETKRARLMVYDLAARSARRVTTGNFDEALPAWAPDSKAIAFTSNRGADPDRTYNSDLFLVTIGTAANEPRALTTFAGKDNDADFGSYPAWSPDGKSIAYIKGGPVELFSYGVQSLAVVGVNGGAAKVLTSTLDRNVMNPIWDAGGSAITVVVEDDGVSRLAKVDVKSGKMTPVTSGLNVVSNPVATAKGRSAMLLSTPTAPTEVYALEGGKPRKLSRHNDAWLDEVTLATATPTAFTAKDGTDVHGFQMLPAGSTVKTPFPTLLYLHGGPQAQHDASFELAQQIAAARGFAVLAPNPRGGTGRGEAYAKALYADWGGPAVIDVLAAVDDAVARGVADPNRLVVGGWSYGGMLTNYVIASDTRFRAAVSGASIANVFAGYGTDQYIRDYEVELGKPWEKPDVWLRNSYPFFQNQKIVTPTLFMVGEKDFNVPALNSEQMYQALRSRGIKTGLVLYPEEYHGIKRPSFVKDKWERWMAWYDGVLK